MTSGRFGGGGGHVPLLPTPGSGPDKSVRGVALRVNVDGKTNGRTNGNLQT